MGISLLDIHLGTYDPPGDSTGLAPVWEFAPWAQQVQMVRIYQSIIKPEDWPEGEVRNVLEPTSLWHYIESAFNYDRGDDPNATLKIDHTAPICTAACYLVNHYIPSESRYERPSILGGYDTGHVNPHTDDDTPDGRLAGLCASLSQAWASYLTRTKLAIIRSTVFGWKAGKWHQDEYTEWDMAFNHKSSWYRVNVKARDEHELRGKLDDSVAVKQAAAAMDADLAAFAAACKVPNPTEKATWKEGNRFPVPKNAWYGRLPIWHRIDGSPQSGELDTTQIAKDFAHHARQFREAVGGTITVWGRVNGLVGQGAPPD